MPDPSKLFLQHPLGDSSTTPCAHFGVKHPNGHEIKVPCLHGFRAKHPNGDTVQTFLGPVTVPCIHVEPIHPQGHTVTIPCTEFAFLHPDGHPGPKVPCVHPMVPCCEDYQGGLIFFTEDNFIRTATLNAVKRLSYLGIDLVSQVRPLQIFHREALEDGSSADPFWSHYSSLHHSIQVLRTPENEGQEGYDRLRRDTLYHEIGHALLGNTPINPYSTGGPHGLHKPAANYPLAMSEGWAHFAALVMTYSSSDDGPIKYLGADWENLEIEPNGKVEYCVGAFLWDLYDRMKQELFHHRGSRVDGRRNARDAQDEIAEISFSQLYSVYSPNLAVLRNGPWVSSVWDYADRLKVIMEGGPMDVSIIDEVLLKNCGPRSASSSPVAQLGALVQGWVGPSAG